MKTENVKPQIVYRQTAKDSKLEKTFSFTISDVQSEFIKTHRKQINFSETFRKYLDSIIDMYNKQD